MSLALIIAGLLVAFVGEPLGPCAAVGMLVVLLGLCAATVRLEAREEEGGWGPVAVRKGRVGRCRR